MAPGFSGVQHFFSSKLHILAFRLQGHYQNISIKQKQRPMTWSTDQLWWSFAIKNWVFYTTFISHWLTCHCQELFWKSRIYGHCHCEEVGVVERIK